MDRYGSLAYRGTPVRTVGVLKGKAYVVLPGFPPFPPFPALEGTGSAAFTSPTAEISGLQAVRAASASSDPPSRETAGTYCFAALTWTSAETRLVR